MKFNSTVNRYIVFDLLPPFVISCSFFIFVFLMARILELTSLVINYNAKLGDILLLFLLMAPFFLKFVIPISVIISVFLIMQKMSGDNEIIALRSSGISIKRIITPVFLFCFISYLITFYMAAIGAPRGQHANNERVKNLASNSIQSLLKERVFFKTIPNLVIFISDIDIQTSKIQGVFIEDKNSIQSGVTIIAPHGKLINDLENKKMSLRLFEGIINQVDPESGEIMSSDFATYNFNLDLNKLVSGNEKEKKNKREMDIFDLRNYIKQAKSAGEELDDDLITRYQVMLALPFSCLVFGMLAFSLGAKKAEMRQIGIKNTLIAVMLIILYFSIYASVYSLGKAGTLNPAIGLWLPNIVLGVISVYFFRNLIKE